MNCEALRSQISEGKYLADATAIEHLELCRECRALAHANEEVLRCLADVRQSAPPVPGSLDASVMTAYRARVTRQHASTGMRVVRPLLWSAVAASFVFAAILVVTHRKPTVTHTVSTPAATTEPTKTSEQASPEVAAEPSPAIRRAKRRMHRASTTETPVAVAARAPSSDGFQNLMFCDPLSCPGPMQVIRIQVPAAAMNRVPAWRPNGGTVQADVAVGSDGIARAIRIVR